MKFIKQHPAGVTVIGALLLAPALAFSADVVKPATTMTPNSAATTTQEKLAPIEATERARMKGWNSDKDMLQKSMKLGEGKAFYSKALADQGFTITSINADRPTYAEYEVVKGDRSYEVQIDFDASAKATKVDVATNMWRTAATKAALKSGKPVAATKYDAANDVYSDRSNMKRWSGDKDALEKALGTGQTKAYYPEQLKKLGYQITATNEREKDYVEYEVVKGADTFEVQIDFDNAGKSKKVDVTTNLWQADATDKAMDRKGMK